LRLRRRFDPNLYSDIAMPSHLHRSTWLFTAGAALFALFGCATGERSIQARSTALDPAQLSSGAAINSAAKTPGQPLENGWWAAFGDPQLDRLLMSDALQSPSIQEGSARVHRALAAQDGAVADTSLRVDATAKAIGERFPDHSVYPAPYAGHWGSEGALVASASYALDFWGKRREAVGAAMSRVDMAKAQADDTLLLLRTAVVDAYVRLDATYRVRDMAIAGLTRRQAVLDLLAVRAKAGLSTDLDAIQAREAITVTRAEIARLDGEIEQCRHQIAALLGHDPAFADQLARPALKSTDDPAPVSAIAADLLGHRPDVAAARAQVEAIGHDIGVARAAFYPDVNLVAFAGVQSLGLGSLLRAGSSAIGGGPTVTLPIFDGGRLRANLRDKSAEYDIAVAAYDAVLTHALQEVADSITTLNAEHTRLREARVAATHWSHAVDLHRLRERQGLSSALHRLPAETSLLLAQRQVVEANAHIATTQLALIRALGGVWSPSSTSLQEQTP
jgi:NodT family efflux transporter outer membrane factor (OMF) lipoprotein